jgi:hypothetical protein
MPRMVHFAGTFRVDAVNQSVPAVRSVEAGAPISWAKIVDSRISRVRPLFWGMLWHTSTPARRPAGFIEPCLPTVGLSVPSDWIKVKNPNAPAVTRLLEE